MNPEVKKRWIEALRSGKYAQGKFYLNRGGAYCCLGVLCDVIDPSRWERPDMDARHLTFGGKTSSLPPSVCEATGLPEWPRINDETLTYMNDNGTPFPEIADLIEKYL